MAAPVIDGINPPSPISFAPGETKAIQVLAHDPDNGAPVSQRLSVADSQGNSTPVLVTLQVADLLTYLADPAPAGWTVVQDASDPSIFHVTAP